MKNKLPKELDPEDVFNKITRAMYEHMQNGKQIARDDTLTLEQRYKTVTHLGARIAGMDDVLRLLGYEVRGADGRLVTANFSLFYEEQTLLIELRKQEKERNKNE